MMFCRDEFFNPDDYIQTSTGNRISRLTNIMKPESLEVPGGRVIIKSGTVIDCNFAAVTINKYTMIDGDSILQPSSFLSDANEIKYIPLTIGSYCHVGKKCIIEAAVIGVGCVIGDNCKINQRAILKDFVTILSDSVVPDDMVIPPFAIVSGNPGKIIGDISASASTLAPKDAMLRYNLFKPKKQM